MGARRRSTGAIALVALIVTGVVATVLSVQAAYASSNDRERQAAALAAARLSGALEQAVGAVRGADGLAADGVIGSGEFRMFARGVVQSSLYSALAFAEVVEQSDREAFVQRTGIDIIDTDGVGGFVPAEPRSRSVVVVEVYPRTEAAASIIGFDIAGEPVRRDATVLADASPTPVLSDRNRTAAGGSIGVSVMHAVRTPGNRVLGYMTSGLSVQGSMTQAGVPASPDDAVGLWMDGQQLTEDVPSRGAEREFVVAGRTFVVRVDAPQSLDLLLPVLIGAGTVVLGVVVARASHRDQRQRAALARLARRNRKTADLGRLLAAAENSESVVSVLGSAVGPILDDARCLVVRQLPDRPEVLPLNVSNLRADIVDWLVGGPVADCVTTGESNAGTSRDDPSAPSEVGSYLCVPLPFSSGFTAGVLAFVWPEEASSTLAEERNVAARTVAELAGPAIERALVGELVAAGAERLSLFARVLAAAPTTAEVHSAVTDSVPAILGAQSAELTLGSGGQRDHDCAGTALERPLLGPGGDKVGVLTVRWRRDAVIGSTQHAVLTTLADLVEQTLGRTLRSQQQLDVISQLQRELLAEPPIIEGLDIAVAYRPALSVVGLGGDFYDVIVSGGGSVYAVIGDITGHGPRAVAVMSELKSVLHQLLQSDTALPDVIAQADELLRRRDVLATAQVFEFDLSARAVRYVNAGHPYPVLRRANGTVGLLRDGHCALLGLADPDAVRPDVATTAFDEGDVLVLYTDGLIERREQDIDTAIIDLTRRVGARNDRSMAALVDRLETELADNGERLDDDIALLALRCVAEPAAPDDATTRLRTVNWAESAATSSR